MRITPGCNIELLVTVYKRLVQLFSSAAFSTNFKMRYVAILFLLLGTLYCIHCRVFQSARRPGAGRRNTFYPPDYDHEVDLPTTRPIIIAHRGSSGRLPEHTREAYSVAIEEGADVIECDVCVTKDLHLVCLHESWIDARTNIADVFNASRMNTYFVQDQGRFITDYFSVDFTLEELKTVRVRQRFSYRDPNHEDMYQITSLEEYIEIAQGAGRPVGIYPETKDPIWVNSLDIMTEAETTFEDLMVAILESYDYTRESDPCFVQSFNPGSIEYFSTITNLPLIQLISAQDLGNSTLESYAEYCYGLGISRSRLVITNSDNQITDRLYDIVDRAHAYGLRIHPYSFRNEDRHLAWDYGQDANLEYEDFLRLGVDGYFTDFPGTLYRFLDAAYNRPEEVAVSVSSATYNNPDFNKLLLYLTATLLVMWR